MSEPLYEFSPEAVFQLMLAKMEQDADRANDAAIVDFHHRFDNAEQNYRGGGRDTTNPPPDPVIRVVVEDGATVDQGKIQLTFGPDLVVDPIPKHSWEQPPPTGPVFGNPVNSRDPMSPLYVPHYVNFPHGHQEVHENGKTYELRVIPHPVSIVVRYWYVVEEG
ncbi:MAG: hypothetical protein GY906_22415 [bacterium]|nr:hypothetical protein [bacterium]